MRQNSNPDRLKPVLRITFQESDHRSSTRSRSRDSTSDAAGSSPAIRQARQYQRAQQPKPGEQISTAMLQEPSWSIHQSRAAPLREQAASRDSPAAKQLAAAPPFRNASHSQWIPAPTRAKFRQSDRTASGQMPSCDEFR